ncbi:MAG: protein kinase [Gemmatimonas sp.]
MPHTLPRQPPAGYTLGPCIGGRPGVTLVFAARNPDDKPCALKTLHEGVSAESVSAARFEREMSAHVACADIPGVVPARAPAGECKWLATDWAHGGDLASACEHSESVRLRIAKNATHHISTLLRALDSMHARDIAHRDIKPSNLLVDGDSLWLTDFGIAGRCESVDTNPEWLALPPPWRETLVGTAPWAAPELSHEPPLVTPASDIYSTAMLWQWLLAALPSPNEPDANQAALISWMTIIDAGARPRARDVLATLA